MTVSNSEFDDLLGGSRFMAILRGMGVERSIRLAETAWDFGIDSVEVPLQTAEDEAALREVVRLGKERGKSVGAGTIVTAEQIHTAKDCGAQYLVAPGFDESLVREAASARLPTIPGVATPSEIQAAAALGLTWVKAFPAAWLGPSWFKLLKGPFPTMNFVATGGLDASNVEDFLNAGVRVAAVGSALEDESQLQRLAQLNTR